MSQSFTPADVAAHNSADKGMYIIVDTGVYDVTNFVDEHPGGAKILKRVAGKDASKQFWKVYHLTSTTITITIYHHHRYYYYHPPRDFYKSLTDPHCLLCSTTTSPC